MLVSFGFYKLLNFFEKNKEKKVETSLYNREVLMCVCVSFLVKLLLDAMHYNILTCYLL